MKLLFLKSAAVVALAMSIGFGAAFFQITGGNIGGGGSGGSGTVNNCAAAGNAFYSATGTAVSCDTTIVDNGAGTITVGTGGQFILPIGSGTVAPILYGSTSTVWWYNCNTVQICLGVSAANPSLTILAGGVQEGSGGTFKWASAAASNGSADTSLSRSAAGIVQVGTGANNANGTMIAQAYQTAANCASSAGTCAAASSGSVSIAAAATTVTVATTAVTANSVIEVTEDSSLGTKLTATCNTTTGRTYSVTARTAATSFVITTSAAPVTNPACLNYTIVN